jgi:hypothetical protein
MSGVASYRWLAIASVGTIFATAYAVGTYVCNAVQVPAAQYQAPLIIIVLPAAAAPAVVPPPVAPSTASAPC